VCIAPIAEVDDLDGGQVPYARFQVVPPDPHGFDGDNDGIGGESNQPHGSPA
jgi:micrococcal nuclease